MARRKAAIKVFVSYTHDSPKHKAKVLNFCDKLVTEGIDCRCDRYDEGKGPTEGWNRWMAKQISETNFVLIVCSENYEKRFDGTEEAGKGRGAKYETKLIINNIVKNDSNNEKYIPIVVTSTDLTFIPNLLDDTNHYNVATRQGYDNLYRHLTNQIEIVRPKVGTVKRLPIRINLKKKKNLKKLDIPELKDLAKMPPGKKIISAFFELPIIIRVAIANKLKLTEPGEKLSATNGDELSKKYLLRAKEHKKLAELWTALFDETKDPNPYKK